VCQYMLEFFADMPFRLRHDNTQKTAQLQATK